MQHTSVQIGANRLSWSPILNSLYISSNNSIFHLSFCPFKLSFHRTWVKCSLFIKPPISPSHHLHDRKKKIEAIKKIASTSSHQNPIGLLPALLCFSWGLVKAKTRGQCSDALLRGRQKGWILGPDGKQTQVLLSTAAQDAGTIRHSPNQELA